MAFCFHVPGFAVQQPRQLQYHVFQQPIFHMSPLSPPHFLTVHSVHPVGVIPAHHLPFAVMMPTPPSPSQSILPPKGLCLRVVFYGHASREHNSPPLCVTNATYADSVPSRDGLLADVASWAGHHGLLIRHAGGRIDPSKVKLYVLPRGRSPGGGFPSLEVVPGGGLAMPGDVIKVVRLEGVEERVWGETLRDVRREGYEGVVAVDMSASSSAAAAAGDSDKTTADEAPAPAASVVDADADANADTGVAASA